MFILVAWISFLIYNFTSWNSNDLVFQSINNTAQLFINIYQNNTIKIDPSTSSWPVGTLVTGPVHKYELLRLIKEIRPGSEESLDTAQISSSMQAAISIDYMTDTSEGTKADESGGDDYILRNRVGRGHFGEVWVAKKRNDETKPHIDDDEEDSLFVMKRIMREKGAHVAHSALREIHYGNILRNEKHIARLIEWFEWRGDLWLVFMYEGISFSSYFTQTDRNGQTKESDHWTNLKIDMMSESERLSWITRSSTIKPDFNEESSNEDKYSAIIQSLPNPKADNKLSAVPQQSLVVPNVKEHESQSKSSKSFNCEITETPGQLLHDLLWQIFVGVASMHFHGATHRDIKPDNILLKLKHFNTLNTETNADIETDSRNPDNFTHTCEEKSKVFDTRTLGAIRICDLGSAVDESIEVTSSLYPSEPPSLLQSSVEYAPPELLFTVAAEADAEANNDNTINSSTISQYGQSYDSWSLGVLILQIIAGSRNRVFQINERARAIISQKLGSNVSPRIKERAILLRAFIDYCIYIPPSDIPSSQLQDNNNPSHSECDLFQFMEKVKSTDEIMGIGFGDNAMSEPLARLTKSLLQWDQDERITVTDSLTHTYFTKRTYECSICHSTFYSHGQRKKHIQTFHP